MSAAILLVYTKLKNYIRLDYFDKNIFDTYYTKHGKLALINNRVAWTYMCCQWLQVSKRL